MHTDGLREVDSGLQRRKPTHLRVLIVRRPVANGHVPLGVLARVEVPRGLASPMISSLPRLSYSAGVLAGRLHALKQQGSVFWMRRWTSVISPTPFLMDSEVT